MNGNNSLFTTKWRKLLRGRKIHSYHGKLNFGDGKESKSFCSSYSILLTSWPCLNTFRAFMCGLLTWISLTPFPSSHLTHTFFLVGFLFECKIMSISCTKQMFEICPCYYASDIFFLHSKACNWFMQGLALIICFN